MKTNNQESAIHNSIIGLFDGISEADENKIIKYCSSEFTLIDEGSITSLKDILDGIPQMKVAVSNRVNNLTFLKTTISENAAWIIYNNNAAITINNCIINYEWIESAILIKLEDFWKIKLLHSTLKNKRETRS